MDSSATSRRKPMNLSRWPCSRLKIKIHTEPEPFVGQDFILRRISNPTVRLQRTIAQARKPAQIAR
jgi:hypothetical protein